MSQKPNNKRRYRQEIFRHLDGLVVAPIAHTLWEQGVLQELALHKNKRLEELAQHFSANEGYMNVALRCLCSQGWLQQEVSADGSDIQFSITQAGIEALPLLALYSPSVQWLLQAPAENKELLHADGFPHWKKAVAHFKSLTPDGESLVYQQIYKHIEGLLIGPVVVHLAMRGMFHKYFMEASFSPGEFHKDAGSFKELLDFMLHLGWFTERKGTYSFSEKGLFFARRASAYGVTVSYLPTFIKLKDLIFGDPAVLRSANPHEAEQHVDREMNVWGSGGAHTTYFKKIDEIIINLFNQPIADQPKGILDMGCGNGAFLKHIYEVIEQRTLRGSLLEEHPLFLVGADFNETALRVTRANLIQADIWAKVIWGDIGRPDLLASDLKEHYDITLADLLNVRTFLDHNRIWTTPKHMDETRQSTSSGAFATKGQRIPNKLVEESLLEHFKKWAPYVNKFGLLLIELHTINPALAAQHIGQTPVTAYDATHGFSDQYIVELDVFQRVAEEAGLHFDPDHFSRFPDEEWATVSINLLRGK